MRCGYLRSRQDINIADITLQSRDEKMRSPDEMKSLDEKRIPNLDIWRCLAHLGSDEVWIPKVQKGHCPDLTLVNILYRIVYICVPIKAVHFMTDLLNIKS